MVEYLLNSNLVHDYNKLSIITLDPEGAGRTKKFSDLLSERSQADISLSLIIQQNLRDDQSKLELVGDVKKQECIILVDIIDSADFLIEAAEKLFNQGASKVYVFATHGVLSGKSIELLNKSRINKIILTNTIPIDRNLINSEKFIVISTATLLAETIRRIYRNESLSEIFMT
jgi:ribose-phosphate pyrophosphokinase